jgi:hypothetical protein
MGSKNVYNLHTWTPSATPFLSRISVVFILSFKLASCFPGPPIQHITDAQTIRGNYKCEVP